MSKWWREVWMGFFFGVGLLVLVILAMVVGSTFSYLVEHCH